MKKRLLSLVLCLVMVFSLFPAFAMPASAVDGDVPEAENLTPGAVSSGGLKLEKSASKDETHNTYSLTLTAHADDAMIEQPQNDDTPTDIVFVVDQSYQMTLGEKLQGGYVSLPKERWTMDEIAQLLAKSPETYYYYDAEQDAYYPISVAKGTMDYAEYVDSTDTGLWNELIPTDFDSWTISGNWSYGVTNYQVYNPNTNSLTPLMVRTEGYITGAAVFNSACEYGSGGYHAVFFYLNDTTGKDVTPGPKDKAWYDGLGADNRVTVAYSDGKTQHDYARSILSIGLGTIDEVKQGLGSSIYYPADASHVALTNQNKFLNYTVGAETRTAYTAQYREDEYRGKIYKAVRETTNIMGSVQNGLMDMVDSIAQDAADTNRDHWVSIVGYGGNGSAYYDSNSSAGGINARIRPSTANRLYYTNTGIFTSTASGFLNYKDEDTSDQLAKRNNSWKPAHGSLWVTSQNGYTDAFRFFKATSVKTDEYGPGVSGVVGGSNYINNSIESSTGRIKHDVYKVNIIGWPVGIPYKGSLDYTQYASVMKTEIGNNYWLYWDSSRPDNDRPNWNGNPENVTMQDTSDKLINLDGSANYGELTYKYITEANSAISRLDLNDLTMADYQGSQTSVNTTSGAAIAKEYIDAFSGYGVTSDPALGLTMAQNVFANSGASASERNRVVVLITNGAPRLSGTITTVNQTLAQNAKNAAKSLKQDGATIYAINLTQVNPIAGVESFLKEVSSQWYPVDGTTQINVHNDGSNYYTHPTTMQEFEDTIANILKRVQQPAKETKVAELTVADYINTEVFDISNAQVQASIGSASIDKNASSATYGKVTVTGADFSGQNTLTVNITGLRAVKGGLQYTNLASSGVYGPDGKLALAFPRPAVDISEPEHEGGLDSNKTIAEAGDGKYTITMDAWATGNVVTTDPVTIEKAAPMDIVLVVDQSGSMATKDMGTRYLERSDDWTVDMVTSGVQYYYKVDETHYYPVQAESGPIYEKVDGKVTPSHSIGWDDEGVSFAINGSPTYFSIPTDYYVKYNNEMHKLYLITVAREIHYSLYPYIYINESAAPAEWHDNIYWALVWKASNLKRSSKWNQQVANIAFVNSDGRALTNADADGDKVEKKYTWISDSGTISNLYRVSDTASANQLYYVDGSGVRHNLGSKVTLADDVAYTGKLWVPDSEQSRLDVMKAAVNAFIDTVADETDGSRMSIVGFAGNKVPARSSGATAMNDTSTRYDYTDTGIFVNGGFKNYQAVGTSNSDFTAYNGTRYINRHYYVKNGSAYQPVRYNASSGVWYNIVTGREVYGSTQFYLPVYQNLTAGDYQASMLNVDSSKAALHSEVANFGAYGGTYTSYGMTMANRILQNTSGSNRKVIIVFTDGEPGGSGYEASIAGEALMDGNRSKIENDATVYTVGLFPGNVSSQVESFMRQLSSEYTVDKTEVYGGAIGASDFNYGLGSGGAALKGNQTYYYINENPDSPDYQKTFAVNAIHNGKSSLGWWIYNSDGSYSLTTPKTSSGAGETEFRLNGQRVTADKVKTNTVYQTSGGQQIVYEYRWFDSNNSIINPKTGANDANTNHQQFYSLGVPMADTGGDTYYMRATDENSLRQVFQTISETLTSSEDIPGTSVTYNADNSYLVDEISEYFDVPADFESDPTKYISVFTVPTSMATQDGPVTLGSTETPLQNPEISVVGKKLYVSNFDYAINYCTVGRDGNALRVKVTGLTPKQTGLIPSNTSDSGVFALNDDGDLVMVEQFDPPTILVPGYTVRWVNYNGDELETDSDLLLNTVAAYDGQIPEKPADVENTYAFSGWGDENGSILFTGNEAPPVTADVTYYAIFTPVQNAYTVNWYDYDGNLLSSNKAAGTDLPMKTGAAPVRDEWSFVGWSVTQNEEFDGNPEHYFLEKTVAEYDQDGNHVVDFYAVYAKNESDTKEVVISYGMKHVIDTGVQDVDVKANPGGDFYIEDLTEQAERSLIFDTNVKLKGDIVDLTPMSQVNRAQYLALRAGKTITTDLTVVVGSSIYFDDSLTDVSPASLNENLFNYEAVLNKAAVDPNAEEIEEGVRLSFTFTGTGIEAYANTDGTSGRVAAYLYQGDTAVQAKIMNNVSEETELYNVPTIRFDVPYGTYRLEIYTYPNANYRLDGLRVFNANQSQTAEFLGIREQLLKQFTDESDQFGALYLVGNGNAAKVSEYDKLGPKNEVYLAPGQSVAFQVMGITGGDYRVGLSAVSGETVNAVVSNGDEPLNILHEVEGKVHMFYTVEPKDGCIVITNNNDPEMSDAILSITDLEIVGGTKTAVTDPGNETESVEGPVLMATRSLMSYARAFDADAVQTVTEPTPDPTDTPTLADMIRQLISNFVKHLFQSVSRLFGN